MRIRHPEWLQLEANNITWYGYDQEWYTTSFQRTRGCGPTAGAMLLLYLNRREAEPLPFQSQDISSITQVLEEIWRYITPGWLLGLNSTGKFRKGMEGLLAYYKLGWQCRRLSVAVLKGKRVSLSHLVQFLEEGIASDCPIAFLNLHKGRATELESWHWSVIVDLAYDATQNRYIATCYDGGRTVQFDVGLWLATSSLGGGFVYITVPS